MHVIFGLSLVPSAVLMFAITNADDIVLLSLFFAGRSGREVRQIVLGQYLGFTVLLGFSMGVGLAGAIVPVRWIAFLGVFPIYLGVRDYVRLWNNRRCGLPSEALPPAKSIFQVAGVTIANGADNLAVYGPVFAQCGWRRTFAISAVFYGMVAVWCLLGWSALRNPIISKKVVEKSHVIIPGALILIGVVILQAALRP